MDAVKRSSSHFCVNYWTQMCSYHPQSLSIHPKATLAVQCLVRLALNVNVLRPFRPWRGHYCQIGDQNLAPMSRATILTFNSGRPYHQNAPFENDHFNLTLNTMLTQDTNCLDIAANLSGYRPPRTTCCPSHSFHTGCNCHACKNKTRDKSVWFLFSIGNVVQNV